MKTFIRIYKGMLLWVSALSILLFILGLESMIEEHRWSLIVVWLIINILFYWMCRNILTIRDLYKLSGTYYIEKLLK